MPSPLTRRHVLAGAAATAAVAAMPAAAAIAAVGEGAPFDTARFIEVCVAETERLHPGVNPSMAGWGFIVNDVTRPLLARLPISDRHVDFVSVLFGLLGESKSGSDLPGPHRWIAANIVDRELQIVGAETWSYRQALIDAGYQLEALS